MDKLRLYLLRHGQTIDFERHLFNGWRDVGLTELGKRQLDDAARVLGRIPLDAVYSSDLGRARYGGEKVAAGAGLTLGLIKDFREMSFGKCEGLNFQELAKLYPELAEGILCPQTGKVSFPEGEDDRGFQARIAGAVTGLLEKHPEGRVCLVSHAGVGRAVLAHFMGLSSSSMWAIHQDFAGLHVLDVYQGGTYIIRALNAYLGPEGYAQDGPGLAALVG
ncbi:MAG: histidine phosphatase family protein [Deltaproteobacteria bacterium]|jgi:broad specificity phosphatase PhoE|nr:histidine phosphatase family protein [Deltaproteobacteria bacterium]